MNVFHFVPCFSAVSEDNEGSADEGKQEHFMRRFSQLGTVIMMLSKFINKRIKGHKCILL